jgi:hypothetical protein
MIIQVYNDNSLAFTGPAAEWLDDNDNDLEVAEMIAETGATGRSERDFFSGNWICVSGEPS